MPALAKCSRTIIRTCRNLALQIPRPVILRPFAHIPAVQLVRPFTNHVPQRDIEKPSSTPTSAVGLRPTANFPSEGGNDPREVFSELDVLSGLPIPASAVDSVFVDGFLLNNGQEVHGDGVFLLNNDVFRWKTFLPSSGDGGVGELTVVTTKAKRTGVLELNEEVWGVLDVVYPKPDLLIIGTGHRTLLLHPNSRKRIQEMGINLDIMDTHNAAAQYNLLATERPGTQIAAALLMAGF